MGSGAEPRPQTHFYAVGLSKTHVMATVQVVYVQWKRLLQFFDVNYVTVSLFHQWAGCCSILRPPPLMQHCQSVAVSALSIWEGHGPMASAVARAYNGGLGRSPQRGPGAEPLMVGQESEAPLKLKRFWFLGIQWKLQICPLF